MFKKAFIAAVTIGVILTGNAQKVNVSCLFSVALVSMIASADIMSWNDVKEYK